MTVIIIFNYFKHFNMQTSDILQCHAVSNSKTQMCSSAYASMKTTPVNLSLPVINSHNLK